MITNYHSIDLYFVIKALYQYSYIEKVMYIAGSCRLSDQQCAEYMVAEKTLILPAAMGYPYSVKCISRQNVISRDSDVS